MLPFQHRDMGWLDFLSIGGRHLYGLMSRRLYLLILCDITQEVVCASGVVNRLLPASTYVIELYVVNYHFTMVNYKHTATISFPVPIFFVSSTFLVLFISIVNMAWVFFLILAAGVVWVWYTRPAVVPVTWRLASCIFSIFSSAASNLVWNSLISLHNWELVLVSVTIVVLSVVSEFNSCAVAYRFSALSWLHS